MKYRFLASFLLLSIFTNAQRVCTPDFLWSLGKLGQVELSKDKSFLYYAVSKTDVQSMNNEKNYFKIDLRTGITSSIDFIPNDRSVTVGDDVIDYKLSPDGNYVIAVKKVLIDSNLAKIRYPQFSDADVYIYDKLNYRHWDTWEDGYYEHLFVGNNPYGAINGEKDIMPSQAFDCPTKPFGGSEDFIFTPNSRQIVYVCKKKSGVDYATSTNTDLFLYDIVSAKTSNLTTDNRGYDLNPTFNNAGNYLAFTRMARDGYESDKNDLMIMDWSSKRSINLTAKWDESVGSYMWGDDNETIYFIAAFGGTEQLFSVNVHQPNQVKQITNGMFDIRALIAEVDNTLYVQRGDMNHASEIYTVNLSNGNMQQITHINDKAYQSIDLPKVTERWTQLGFGDKLFSWVIYPPNFDARKKYPVLLYCQGGPQGALSQFYSFRWNFQLMASQGYIVIAPNRTGMPGWGTAWNQQISGDWGGLAMKHYLAAIDDIAEEDYVDKNRLGAVGASYGGYSVFELAGIHEGRFKTFISHCGLFDLQSWYGTTEELFFANWDIGGPYWDRKNNVAQRTYENFNPSSKVDKWNTPILIFQGGKDFRVPIEQGLQAFQAAQLKGLKSRLVFLPGENHWVLSPQNAMVWQNEFFRWLKETL